MHFFSSRSGYREIDSDGLNQHCASTLCSFILIINSKLCKCWLKIFLGRFFFLSWFPEEMKLACITLLVCQVCSASSKLDSVIIFYIVRSYHRPTQHSAHHGRQLPKSLILLSAEESGSQLGSAGSSG